MFVCVTVCDVCHKGRGQVTWWCDSVRHPEHAALSNSVRLVCPGSGFNSPMILSLSLSVVVSFIASFFCLFLYFKCLSQRLTERRESMGGRVDIHLWEKYLGGRERESKGVGVGKEEEAGREERESWLDWRKPRRYAIEQGERQRSEAEGRVTKWMQFAVACRWITVKSTGRRADWTWINKWIQKNWMNTEYEKKIREDEESVFICFYLGIRLCCEEPMGRKGKIADNSFFSTTLRSRGAVRQNRADCGTRRNWIHAQ